MGSRPTDDKYRLEVSHCSACGKNQPNGDYVLYEDGVGMCVADGIGGAPMGDAVARYACHVAMGILRGGGTACEAIEGAGVQVARFVTTVDSPASGTSLVVARLIGTMLETSWVGDTAIFVASSNDGHLSLSSNLECNQPQSARPLCGEMPTSLGNLLISLKGVKAVAICTDGVWRVVDKETIGRLLLGDVSPREVAARLVLGYRSGDDATALVAKIRRRSSEKGLKV